MKNGLLTLIAALMLMSFSDQAYAQGRLSQFEVYLGANLPLAPDSFKDSYTMGISGNVQYVFFPAPNIGLSLFGGYEFFPVDTDAISGVFRDELVGIQFFDPYYGGFVGEITDANLDSEGSASLIRLGAGVRPYLTPPTASTQFFLFGNATFNILKEKSKINGGSTTVTNLYGEEFTFELSELLDQSFFEEEVFDANKFGVGIGGGLELPAGDNVNLILQAVFNLVFLGSEDVTYIDEFGDSVTESVSLDNVSFIGITAGLVF